LTRVDSHEGRPCLEQDPKDALHVEPAAGLRGSTTVPGDKSISHRALIFGAVARGGSEICNLSPGEDVASTRRCLEALGASSRHAGEALRWEGWGAGVPREPEQVLDAGNSGTTIRLLAGLLSAQSIFSVITGDESLRRRPMDRIVVPLRQMGAEIFGRQGGRFAPLAIRGRQLKPIVYHSPVSSAQVKTALLLAGLGLEGLTEITEPALSRDHSERMLRFLGADLERQGQTVRLRGGRVLEARPLQVPGDPSSAAFLLVAAVITERSQLEVRDVCVNPTRIGYLQVLQRMGAAIRWHAAREVCGEPVADLQASSSHLRATEIVPEEIPSCIDEIPVLCVAAAFAEGTTRISGARELRVKESDRIAAVAANLARMGVVVREKPSGLEIEGQGRGGIRGFYGESWDDHRIALSLIVAALAATGPSRISGYSCMAISFPGFLERLTTLRLR